MEFNFDKFKKAIETYQCPGCISGSDISCFNNDIEMGGHGCGKHLAGTFGTGIGKFLLGMPKGFNIIGFANKFRPVIFDSFDSSDCKYCKFNIPVWKYLDEYENTIVRGMMPRLNQTFIHIYLENCIDKINCLEITKSDIDEMD